MNAEDVSRIVKTVSHEMRANGESQPYDGYIVNPMYVLDKLRKTELGVIRHLQRYYRSDPYQQLKVWVPRG